MIRPSNNLENKTPSGILKSSANMYESPGLQFLEPLLEYCQNQTPLQIEVCYDLFNTMGVKHLQISSYRENR